MPQFTQQQIAMWDLTNDGAIDTFDVLMAQEMGPMFAGVASAIQQALTPDPETGIAGTFGTQVAGYGQEVSESYNEYVANPEQWMERFGQETGYDAAVGQRTTAMVTSGFSANRSDLNRMLSDYTGRRSNIQSANRQKRFLTIDRFDGGLNLNKSPRDLADKDAMELDELTPSKIGRLVRLGDFSATTTYAMALAGADTENYGLHYFTWSDSVGGTGLLSGGSPSNYLAYNDGQGDINIYNFTDGVIATVDDLERPGSHSAWEIDRIHTDVSQTSTDGSGTGLVCDISTDGSGHTTFVIVSGGTGYVVDEEITFTDPGSTSNTAVLIVATIPNLEETVIDGFASTGLKPVYHSGANKLFVSDASFGSSYTYVCGIRDRPKLFPYNKTGSYNVSGTTGSTLIANDTLYPSPPTKGVDAGNVLVSFGGTGFTRIAGGTDGIYMNITFQNAIDDSTTNDAELGWGGELEDGSRTYRFFASFLYDENSETQLTDVGSSNNTSGGTGYKEVENDGAIKQNLEVSQIKIDGTKFLTNFPRIHGARFYFEEVSSAGTSLGNDRYCFAELDFAKGFRLLSEVGEWILFEDDRTVLTAIQVQDAAETTADDNTAPDGTLLSITPPFDQTFFVANTFEEIEIKTDLMWKCSATGNGYTIIGNVKYDGREYPDAMIYSGAAEDFSGTNYPQWGVFPVDSNKIVMDSESGAITALAISGDMILQFRQNTMYLIDASDIVSASLENKYLGLGVHGSWAVAETPYGIAWVNDVGVYSYDKDGGGVKSLTIGRLDSGDMQAASPHANTKIGYDDRAKMLIITNNTKKAVDGYHYAYSYITDSWCTWDTNKGYAPKSNLLMNHNGYLTGATRSSTNLIVSQWSAAAQAAAAVTYITKDFDMGKPHLDKRFFTLYISYTGGSSQNALNVYFRVNGKEGDDIASGWHQLETIQDYTDPYFTTSGTAWANSGGDPVTGNPTVNIDTGLNSTNVSEVQKLAKINLRNLGTTDTVDETDTGGTTFPKDYLKFARSIQFKIAGTAATTFEINDISLVYKEKRLK